MAYFVLQERLEVAEYMPKSGNLPDSVAFDRARADTQTACASMLMQMQMAGVDPTDAQRLDIRAVATFSHFRIDPSHVASGGSIADPCDAEAVFNVMFSGYYYFLRDMYAKWLMDRGVPQDDAVKLAGMAVCAETPGWMTPGPSVTQ